MIPGQISVWIATPTRTRDKYGNFTETWTVVEHAGCLFEPEQSSERTDSRSPGVTSPARLYMPATTPPITAAAVLALAPGAHVTAGKLVLDGEAWSAEGNVERWPDVVVNLTRWTSPA